jgi:hypothetical protein
MTDNTIRTTTNAMATIASPAVPGTAGVARGRVSGKRDNLVVFAPHGTNYELHLVAPDYSGPVERLGKGVVRVTARKVWTVPSGGNFIAPIFGPPRIVQGRVRALDERTLVVQAGTPVVVELPEDPSGIDLANGPIVVGALVNVTALPGARFEPVSNSPMSNSPSA